MCEWIFFISLPHQINKITNKMKHESLSVADQLIKVFIFLNKLGYNTENLTVDEAIQIKNGLFKVINELNTEVKDKLQKPRAEDITSKF